MPDDHPIVVERTVAVAPDVVWPYLTDAALWTRWQGESADIEAVVGGRFAVRMADGPIASGQILEVDPPKRLVLTWGWTGTPFELPPGSTTVTFDLTPLDDGGTRITITHRDLPQDLAGHHLEGWKASLVQLEFALDR